MILASPNRKVICAHSSNSICILYICVLHIHFDYLNFGGGWACAVEIRANEEPSTWKKVWDLDAVENLGPVVPTGSVILIAFESLGNNSQISILAIWIFDKRLRGAARITMCHY